MKKKASKKALAQEQGPFTASELENPTFRGLVYGMLGDHAEAVEVYQEAIRLNPDDANAHCGLGEATFRCLGPRRRWMRSGGAPPGSKLAHAYNSLGLAFFTLGQHEEAVDALKKRSAWSGRSLRSAAGSALLNGAARRALEAFQSDRLDPSVRLLWRLKPTACWNGMTRRWRAEVTPDPDNAPAYYGLGESLFQLGRYANSRGVSGDGAPEGRTTWRRSQPGVRMRPPGHYTDAIKAFRKVIGSAQTCERTPYFGRDLPGTRTPPRQ